MENHNVSNMAIAKSRIKKPTSDIFNEIINLYQYKRSSEHISWLTAALSNLSGFKIDYGTVSGCMCGSCNGYNMSWYDENDKEIKLSDGSFSDLIEEGMKIISRKDIWGF